MKKLIAFVLAMLMLASFTACGTSAGSSEPAAVDTGLAEGKTVTEFLDAFQAHFEGLALDPIDDALLQDIYMVNPENAYIFCYYDNHNCQELKISRYFHP